MKDQWADISFVNRSRVRKAILRSLQKPKMPTEIAKELDTNVTQISRALRELEKRELVECLTPEERKGKYYSRTEKGNHIEEIK
jgi:predicted transcriptional regulator